MGADAIRAAMPCPPISGAVAADRSADALGTPDPTTFGERANVTAFAVRWFVNRNLLAGSGNAQPGEAMWRGPGRAFDRFDAADTAISARASAEVVGEDRIDRHQQVDPAHPAYAITANRRSKGASSWSSLTACTSDWGSPGRPLRIVHEWRRCQRQHTPG
ncbi:hypothetical protein [Streptomyces sp. NRRL B-3648]|uniref:hypothetical protein n=1 Tax=Streptomyces sp. NRRL B-3648 TaxID=1519493 RepID=UPI0018FF0293|nr:hypothetical protein [Streptomyces sp. NRRL B-3648]